MSKNITMGSLIADGQVIRALRRIAQEACRKHVEDLEDRIYELECRVSSTQEQHRELADYINRAKDFWGDDAF